MNAKKIPRYAQFFFGLIILFVAQVKGQEVKGVACIIFADNNVVLIRDLLSNRLSFPGGYVDRGETAEQAAQRETYEETGLRVTVGPQITHANHSAQFLCKSSAPIPVLSSQGIETMLVVYALAAPDFSIEIREVYLTKPKLIKPDKYRFPDQINLLPPDLSTFSEWQSQTTTIGDPALPINLLHRFELPLIQQLQTQLMPNADLLFKLFNLLGESKLFFLCVPIIWAFAGWQTGFRSLLLLSISAETENILKILFALPRPFQLIPNLQHMEGYGFGMPSGHATVAVVFWGYCWLKFKHLLPKTYHNLAFLTLIAMLIGCAISRVYWGVHFFSDSLAGMLLGLSILFAFLAGEKYGLWHAMENVQKIPWLIYLGIFFSGIFFIPGQLPSQLFGLTVGLFIGLAYNKTNILNTNSSQHFSHKLMTAFLGICGVVTFDQFAKLLANQQATGFKIIFIFLVAYVLIGLWLSVGIRKIVNLKLVIHR